MYGYVYVNTDGLIEYCSMTEYIPEKYINLFNERLNNTINYSTFILDKYYDVKDRNSLKEIIADKSIEFIENDYQNIKKKYPKITKSDYCKMYDDNAKDFVI